MSKITPRHQRMFGIIDGIVSELDNAGMFPAEQRLEDIKEELMEIFGYGYESKTIKNKKGD